MASLIGTTWGSDLVSSYNPQWYCNGGILAGWLGCPSDVVSKQEQLDRMRSNFGPSIDPNLANQAVENFGTYLDQTGYEGEVAKLTCQDSLLGCSPFNIPWSTIGWIGLGRTNFTY